LADSAVTILRDGKPISVKGLDVATGSETTYDYDIAGRVTLVDDKARTLKRSTQYDPTSGKPSIVRTWGNAATFEAAANDAKTETVNTYYPISTSAVSNWTTFVTSWNRLKSSAKDGAMPTYFAYAQRGETAYTWGGTYPTWTEYDNAGRLSKLHTYRDAAGSLNFFDAAWPAGAGAGDVTTWVYLPTTQLVQQKLDGASMGPSFTYDTQGRLESRINAETSEATVWQYNLAGSPIAIGPRSFQYDAKGRLSSVSSDSSEGDPYSHTITYASDQSSVTDTSTSGDEVTSYFDLLGRKTGVRYGYGGQTIIDDKWNYSTSSMVQSINHNPALASWGNVTLEYKPSTDWLEKVRFNNANLLTTRTPDALWRLKKTHTTRGDGTTPLPTSLGKFEYEYGAFNGEVRQRNKRAAATLGNDAKWKYGYNDRGEVTSGSKKWWGGTEEPVAGAQFAYNFDAIGNRTSTTVNGQNATYTSNSLNQYESRTVPGAVDVSGIFSDDSVAVSPDVQGTELKVHAESSGSQKKQFHRQLTVNNTAGPLWQPVKVTVVKNNLPSGADDIREELRHADVPQSPEQFVHDAEGNLREAGEWLYGFTLSNRLNWAYRAPGGTQAAPGINATYGYDAMGRRVWKEVYRSGSVTSHEKTRYVWDGWRLIAEWDITGAVPALLRTYHWGLDLSGTIDGAGGVGGLLAMVDHTASGGPKTYHYTYDGNANVVALIDAASGAVAAEYEYGPFGEQARTSGYLGQTNPFRFSTHYFDEEVALVYAKHRYFSPTLGRWLGRDPIEEEGGPNLYALLSNDSINDIDPFGECVYIRKPTGDEGTIIKTRLNKLRLILDVTENDPGKPELAGGQLVHQGKPAQTDKPYDKLYVVLAGGVAERAANRHFITFDVIEVTLSNGKVVYKRVRGSIIYSISSDTMNGTAHGQVFGSFATQFNSNAIEIPPQLDLETWGAYGWNQQYALQWGKAATPQPAPIQKGYMPQLYVIWDLADPKKWSTSKGEPRPYEEDGGSDKGWGRIYRTIYGCLK
jgi:RHS repeat-associated protein